MKKFFAAILSVVLGVGFMTSCGGKESQSSADGKDYAVASRSVRVQLLQRGLRFGISQSRYRGLYG